MTIEATQVTDVTELIAARDGAAIVLYSKPRGCVQCDTTKRKFKKEGVEYTDVDVTTDETALEFIKGLGYAQAPVVYVSKADGTIHHWSGYDVNEIDEHILGKAKDAA